jgi:chitinase
MFLMGAFGNADALQNIDERASQRENQIKSDDLSVQSLASSEVIATSFPLVAQYRIDSSWSAGYEATVTLTNNTTTPTTSWVATFTLPQGQSISSLWNGVYTANNQQITVTNPRWIGGGIIPAGGSTTFGMIVHKPSTGIPALNNLQALANASSNLPIPTAPVLNPIVVSSSSPNSYTVSWNSVPYASTYQLEQDLTSAFSNPVVVAQGTMLSKSFSNQPNGTYYYRVSASNSSGKSPYSNVQSVTINVPTQLSAPILQPIDNPTGANQYQIKWSAVAGAAGYTLKESTSSDFSTSQTVYTGANTSFQVSGKAPGNYFYQVVAFAGSVISGPSNIEEVSVTQQPPSQTTPIVESYWESWNSRDSVTTIVQMKVDVINIAFGTFTSTGNHTFVVSGVEADQTTLTQLVTAAHNAGKKVKLSIGGATYPLSTLLKTTDDAIGMATALANYVQHYALDGVDFDIEDYPAASLQVALIQNTRQLLGNLKLITYTPKSPASTTSPYNTVIQSAHPYLDSINIMAYDYGPGYSYQEDTSALVAMGVPISKITIGLMPGYDDLHVMTSLNDISNAAQYIKANGLKGIMFWDLNRDHENLTGLGADAATNTAWNIFHQ